MIKLGTIIICLALGNFINEADSAILNVNSFFNVQGNLTLITWAREVNSLGALTQALNGTAMMIEADVTSQLSLVTSNTTNITTQITTSVIGLPGVNVIYNFTLFEFLNNIASHNLVVNNTRKGVQLNFRRQIDLEAALINLLLSVPRFNFPLWINSDIVPGAGAVVQLPSIEARDFFDLSRGFRTSTLSVGWTTVLQGIALSNANINAMVNALVANNVDQPITFSVRADIAGLSTVQLQNLLNSVSGSSITIWGTPVHLTSNATITNIRNLVLNVGVNRTFIAIPDNFRNQLNLFSSAGIASLSTICIAISLLLNLT